MAKHITIAITSRITLLRLSTISIFGRDLEFLDSFSRILNRFNGGLNSYVILLYNFVVTI